MKIGVLVSPQSWYRQELEQAIQARGHQFTQLDFAQLVSSVETMEQKVFGNQLDLTTFQALIVRTMPLGSLEQVVFRMDVLAQLQSLKIPVVNSPKAIELAIDKYLTTWKLAQSGLPVPRTIVCENSVTALKAFEELGQDVIVKPIFGAEGRGIVRVSDPEIALRTFRTLERIQAVLYLQQYIDHQGSDIRVLLLNGEIIGSIRRKSDKDFRTNVSLTGSAELHQLTDQEHELSLRAAEAVGTTFAGIDLMYDQTKTCYLIEVNSSPGWRVFQKVTEIDVADRLIQYLETLA